MFERRVRDFIKAEFLTELKNMIRSVPREFHPRRIALRDTTSRWGSCSSKGNLNFNCILVLCPEWVRDYVVIHELCHRREMNHSPRFWALVAANCPDYNAARRWLKTQGRAIMERV